MTITDERFTEIYRQYRPHTMRVIARQVRRADRPVVEDLAQTTFLKAWPHLDRALQVDPDLHGLLATIARRVVCRYYSRSPGRRGAAETPVPPDASLWASTRIPTTTAADTTVTDGGAELAEALSRLPAEVRRVVELRFLHDLPISEVVARTGRARATVIRWTAEGLAALRAQLTDPDQDRVAGPAIDDPVERARRAVSELRGRRNTAEREARRLVRAAQLARWHTTKPRADDHTANAMLGDHGSAA